jgi:hypothetical protein
MSEVDAPARREIASIAGDAALFSAALVFAAPLTLVLGPAAAWALHRRRFDRDVVTSGLMGLLGALALGGFVIALIALYAKLSGRFDASNLTGGIILLVVSGAALLAVAFVLGADAVKDLLSGRRLRVWLDVARLSAIVALAVGSVVVTLSQMVSPASEVGDAGPFALAFAAVGARRCSLAMRCCPACELPAFVVSNAERRAERSLVSYTVPWRMTEAPICRVCTRFVRLPGG